LVGQQRTQAPRGIATLPLTRTKRMRKRKRTRRRRRRRMTPMRETRHR
jgi:hypothetical protein